MRSCLNVVKNNFIHHQQWQKSNQIAYPLGQRTAFYSKSLHLDDSNSLQTCKELFNLGIRSIYPNATFFLRIYTAVKKYFYSRLRTQIAHFLIHFRPTSLKITSIAIMNAFSSINCCSLAYKRAAFMSRLHICEVCLTFHSVIWCLMTESKN